MPVDTIIFSIGHSTHPIDDFLALLARHGIQALADIRRFPGSRKFPHFNQADLAAAVQRAGMEYHWLEALGGRRGKSRTGPPTVNLGLQNEGFRNYADYMGTREFQEAASRLRELARRRRTAMMCAEALYWRCHRRLVSDFLLAGGATVQHILPDGKLRPHQLTDGARADAGRVTYPGPLLLPADPRAPLVPPA